MLSVSLVGYSWNYVVFATLYMFYWTLLSCSMNFHLVVLLPSFMYQFWLFGLLYFYCQSSGIWMPCGDSRIWCCSSFLRSRSSCREPILRDDAWHVEPLYHWACSFGSEIAPKCALTLQSCVLCPVEQNILN